MPQGVFAFVLAASLVAAVVCGTEPVSQPTPTGVFVHLVPWTPTPFADVALGDPDLAACFTISPGFWAAAAPSTTTVDERAVGAALASELGGVMDAGWLPPRSVTFAAGETGAVAAVVHGESGFVMTPKTQPFETREVARALAAAVLTATLRPAPPDPRCGEPLLALAEAVADAGSFALAALPPTLRPVREWIERQDAAAALDAMATQALDPTVPWHERRAGLARLASAGGAGPQFAAAAASVVEAFGDAARARRRPFDLLLAWREGRGKAYPPMPRALRAAVAKPIGAGLPGEEKKADRDEVARDTLVRLVAQGEFALAEIPRTANLALRLEAAAWRRAAGGAGLCAWLAQDQLPAVRTGCRQEGEGGGLVVARPRDVGFEVVWRSAAGDEAPLVVWPRWLLFPAVLPALGELWFIDTEGIWRLPLDGHAAPRLAAPGAFRHLAAAPDGTGAATARWPGGEVVVIGEGGVRPLGINGRGGIAWLDRDLIAASDGEKLSLASLQGEVRRAIAGVPCCRALAATPGGLTAGVTAPCRPGLVRVALPERTATPLLELRDGPSSVVPLGNGGLAFGNAEGLFLWRGAGAPQRIGSGLTPGPG